MIQKSYKHRLYLSKAQSVALSEILSGQVSRLAVMHKDRLLCFGADLVFAICEAKQVDVVILNKGENTTSEEDLEERFGDHRRVFGPALRLAVAQEAEASRRHEACPGRGGEELSRDPRP